MALNAPLSCPYWDFGWFDLVQVLCLQFDIINSCATACVGQMLFCCRCPLPLALMLLAFLPVYAVAERKRKSGAGELEYPDPDGACIHRIRTLSVQLLPWKSGILRSEQRKNQLLKPGHSDRFPHMQHILACLRNTASIALGDVPGRHLILLGTLPSGLSPLCADIR